MESKVIWRGCWRLTRLAAPNAGVQSCAVHRKSTAGSCPDGSLIAATSRRRNSFSPSCKLTDEWLPDRIGPKHEPCTTPCQFLSLTRTVSSGNCRAMTELIMLQIRWFLHSELTERKYRCGWCDINFEQRILALKQSRLSTYPI